MPEVKPGHFLIRPDQNIGDPVHSINFRFLGITLLVLVTTESSTLQTDLCKVKKDFKNLLLPAGAPGQAGSKHRIDLDSNDPMARFRPHKERNTFAGVKK